MLDGATLGRKSTFGGRTEVDLRGAATFIRLPKVAAAIEHIPRGTNLHIHLEHLDYVDHACLDLLMSWSKQHKSTGGAVTIDWESLHGILRQNGRPTRHEVAH